MSRPAVAATALLLLSAAAPASADVFFDRTAWEAAVGEVTAPDYDALDPLDFPAGTTDFYGFFDAVVEKAGGTSNFNGVGNFVFSFDADEVRSVTFAFDEAITGFSANWSNTFVQAGFRVSSPFNDYDLNGLSGDLNDQFIGFTEDAAFDTVTFTTTEPLGDDFVFFSEFDFGGAPAAVPEPGTFALLAVAAAGGVIRRRRRAASRG